MNVPWNWKSVCKHKGLVNNVLMQFSTLEWTLLIGIVFIFKQASI